MRKIIALCIAAVSLVSCMTPEITKTARSGVEQLLISTSADRALAATELPSFAGRKVAIDTLNLDCVDKPYVLAAMEAVLAGKGALICQADEAELIVGFASGALATDQDSFLIGLPGLPIPIPGVGTMTTPELALVKKQSQLGVAKLVAQVKDVKTGQLTSIPTATLGSAYFNRWKCLFIFSWSNTDIPHADDVY